MPCNDIHYSKDLRIRRWSACTYLKIYKTQKKRFSEMAHEEQIWCTVRSKGGELLSLGNVDHSCKRSSKNHEEYDSSIMQQWL